MAVRDETIKEVFQYIIDEDFNPDMVQCGLMDCYDLGYDVGHSDGFATAGGKSDLGVGLGFGFIGGLFAMGAIFIAGECIKEKRRNNYGDKKSSVHNNC